MKDRFQNLGRGVALGAAIGTAFIAGGCVERDVSYRDRTWGISVSTEEGDAYCYSDIMPENRLRTYVDENGAEVRWWNLRQNNFACDNAEVLGYETGENIIFLAIGSSWPQEPVLEKLK